MCESVREKSTCGKWRASHFPQIDQTSPHVSIFFRVLVFECMEVEKNIEDVAKMFRAKLPPPTDHLRLPGRRRPRPPSETRL